VGSPLAGFTARQDETDTASTIIAADETLRLRYAVLVADGLTDDDRAKSLAAQAQKALTS
jgi:hypothetical protein